MDDQRDNKGRYRKGNGPWKKGQSGNPKGRPVSLTSSLREYLQQHPEKVKAMVESVVEEAIGGSVRHAELAWQRIDGKVPDVLRVDTNVFNVNQPGVATGKYELADDDADDQSAGTDP